MSFQIHALPGEEFTKHFQMSASELTDHCAIRSRVTECPGTPCRVSLEDATVGEEVLLIHYQHQPAETPYKASHAIFVRQHAQQAFPDPGQVPILFRHRLISVRAFTACHFMIDAATVEGTALETAIERLLAIDDVSYIHLHYAAPGCFAARVTRSK